MIISQGKVEPQPRMHSHVKPVVTILQVAHTILGGTMAGATFRMNMLPRVLMQELTMYPVRRAPPALPARYTHHTQTSLVSTDVCCAFPPGTFNSQMFCDMGQLIRQGKILNVDEVRAALKT